MNYVNRIKHRAGALVCALAFLCVLSGCQSNVSQSEGTVITDDLGREVTVAGTDRVVALMGSYADVWMLSGGSLVGVTSDAVEEHGLDVGDAKLVGSVKSPSLEEIISCDPTLVLLSTDVAGHLALLDSLSDMGIPALYFKVDSLDDYLSMLERCTLLTGNTDGYETYGTAVAQEAAAVMSTVEGKPSPRVLLIRAYSTGAKAKGADHPVGKMLQELGTDNIVDRYDSLLESLSIEAIIEADPEVIFITTMGDETAALTALESGVMSDPAWAGLSAVKTDRVVVLPKDLFHYKPNARWGESYRYLAEVLYET